MMTRWWTLIFVLEATGVWARGGGRTSGGTSRAYDPYDTGYDPYGRGRSYDPYRREYDTYYGSNTYGSTGGNFWNSDYGFYLGTLWVPQYIITLLVIFIFFTCCCCCCCGSRSKHS